MGYKVGCFSVMGIILGACLLIVEWVSYIGSEKQILYGAVRNCFSWTVDRDIHKLEGFFCFGHFCMDFGKGYL